MLSVDLCDPVVTRASVEEALGQFGHVDMLVNNAGRSPDQSIYTLLLVLALYVASLSKPLR